ncbi:MAG: hypothetical protein GY756_21390 [bacterium]|nr:hypothetical protein [bacterium]
MESINIYQIMSNNIIVAIIIASAYLFLKSYIKKLPETFQTKSVEKFKSELSKEVERIKINESQLQIRKIEWFLEFNDFMNDVFTNPETLKKITLINPEELEKELANTGNNESKAKLRKDIEDYTIKFNLKMLKLGSSLFYFASDRTVKKYVEWRLCYLNAGSTGFEPIELLKLYGELSISIRKDLGYENTTCNVDDFLNILIKDWEMNK